MANAISPASSKDILLSKEVLKNKQLEAQRKYAERAEVFGPDSRPKLSIARVLAFGANIDAALERRQDPEMKVFVNG